MSDNLEAFSSYEWMNFGKLDSESSEVQAKDWIGQKITNFENTPESMVTSIVDNWVLIADPYVRMNEFWKAHS